VTRLVRGRVTDASGNGIASAGVYVVDTDARIWFQGEVLVNPILLEFCCPSGVVENSLRGSGMVEGVRAGTGVVSWSYRNVGGSLTITVTP
jgi:hypothetical protein